MIKKKNLWFLTLFSLVLVLSVYYVTMPNELLVANNSSNTVKEEKVLIEEANIIETLKSEDNNNTLEEINKLNSKAIIIGRQWSNTKSEELIPKVFLAKDKGNVKEKINFRKSNLNAGNIKKEKSEENLFESFALKIDKDVSKEELLSKFNFIKNSYEFGEIIRAKGIVNTKNGKEQFDYTLSEINMQKIAYRGETIISFIGTNLNKEKIKKFFS